MKKKIFLASFMQKENFGKGKVIAITFGNKPKEFEVKHIYLPFTPPTALIDSYNAMAADKSKREEAGIMFQTAYRAQLDAFVAELTEAAKADNVKPQDLLPFEDGDTLCSWERDYRTNHRKVLAPYLEKLGYEVVLN